MITLEVNGTRVEAETEKEARKQLAKLVREQKKADAAHAALRDAAYLKAESAGYRALKFKARGQFPGGCECVLRSDSRFHLLAVVERVSSIDGKTESHKIDGPNGVVVVSHCGNDLIGIACQGSGYPWLLFLKDRTTQEVLCMSFATEGDAIGFAECPGILPEDFDRKQTA